MTGERSLGEVSLTETKDLMTSTMKLLEVLDPLVEFQDSVIDLLTMKDPYKSYAFLSVASLTIMYFEVAIPLWFIAFAVYI